jgi:uncharacterized membrane protein YuzA (DUF378 family)
MNMMNNYLFFVKNIIIEEEKMNILYKTALVLGIVGCINWGLVGLFNFNLVEYLLGDGALITRTIYVLVMVAGLIQIALLPKNFDHLDH